MKLEEWTLWLIEKKRVWITGLSFGAGVLILFLSFHQREDTQSGVVVESAYRKWVSSGDDTSYVEMRQLLHRNPRLERRYLPLIAQKLIERHNLIEAMPLAESTEPFLGDVPFHGHYSKTTLHIEKGEYQEALERSVHLKEWMGSEAGAPLLYAHNLLRIATLQRELGNRFGEKAAWEDLEAFLKLHPDLLEIVLGNFREKGLDLSNYIAERKKQLY